MWQSPPGAVTRCLSRAACHSLPVTRSPSLAAGAAATILGMDLPIEWLPEAGRAEQLILLLHGHGEDGRAMAPLAQALRAEFPQAAVLAPSAPQQQWYGARAGAEDTGWPWRVADASAALRPWVRSQQQQLGVGAAATALGGFSEGAVLALQTALDEDGLVGRVLAFGGRLVRPPEAAPRLSTLHFFHGSADPVIPARHSALALEQLSLLQGDATLDVAEGVGRELHPALIQRLLFRLRHHIPARTWAAALGSVPMLPDETEEH